MAANQESGQADNLEAQIVDYSVCPKCNSSNLSKLTAEQIKAERSPTANNILTSSTDELKKLKELLDCGVITQEEFGAKKKSF